MRSFRPTAHPDLAKKPVWRLIFFFFFNGCGSKPIGTIFGVGSPPILEPVSVVGLGPVHWVHDLDFDPWPYLKKASGKQRLPFAPACRRVLPVKDPILQGAAGVEAGDGLLGIVTCRLSRGTQKSNGRVFKKGKGKTCESHQKKEVVTWFTQNHVKNYQGEFPHPFMAGIVPNKPRL